MEGPTVWRGSFPALEHICWISSNLYKSVFILVSLNPIGLPPAVPMGIGFDRDSVDADGVGCEMCAGT